jgi:hypothetical protein
MQFGRKKDGQRGTTYIIGSALKQRSTPRQVSEQAEYRRFDLLWGFSSQGIVDRIVDIVVDGALSADPTVGADQRVLSRSRRANRRSFAWSTTGIE